MSKRCRILLVRHGQAAMPDALGRVFNYSPIPLTDAGRRQAEGVRSLLADTDLHAVFSSDLLRAEETARLIAGDQGQIRVDGRLREIDIGEYNGMTLPRLRKEAPPFVPWLEVAFAGRFSGTRFHVSHRARFPGGESMEDAFQRALPAFQAICEAWPDANVVVVSHGWIIQALVSHAVEAGIASYHRFAFANSSLIVLEADGSGRGALRALNANLDFDRAAGRRLGDPKDASREQTVENGDRAITCRVFLLDRPTESVVAEVASFRLEAVLTDGHASRTASARELASRAGVGCQADGDLASPDTAPAALARAAAAHLGGAIGVSASPASLEAIAWRVADARPIPDRLAISSAGVGLVEVEADGRGVLHVLNGRLPVRTLLATGGPAEPKATVA